MRSAVVGAFCAVDVRPRAWTGESLTALRDLAELAATDLERRTALRDAQRADALLDAYQSALAALTLEHESLRRLATAVTHDSIDPALYPAAAEEAARLPAGWPPLSFVRPPVPPRRARRLAGGGPDRARRPGRVLARAAAGRTVHAGELAGWPAPPGVPGATGAVLVRAAEPLREGTQAARRLELLVALLSVGLARPATEAPAAGKARPAQNVAACPRSTSSASETSSGAKAAPALPAGGARRRRADPRARPRRRVRPAPRHHARERARRDARAARTVTAARRPHLPDARRRAPRRAVRKASLVFDPGWFDGATVNSTPVARSSPPIT